MTAGGQERWAATVLIALSTDTLVAIDSTNKRFVRLGLRRAPTPAHPANLR